MATKFRPGDRVQLTYDPHGWRGGKQVYGHKGEAGTIVRFHYAHVSHTGRTKRGGYVVALDSGIVNRDILGEPYFVAATWMLEHITEEETT